MDTETTQGDYVLVPARKAKISRARKGIIGTMVLGAVIAITGSGTFASFSATTANQADFRTGRIDLSNEVDTGQACFASGTGADNVADDDANTDENANDTCDALFDDNLRPGVAATAELTLTNDSTSDYNGELTVFADTITFTNCVSALNEGAEIGGTGNLCDGVEVIIQETDLNFANPVCVWPAADCVFDDGDGTINDFIAAFPSAQTALTLETLLPETESRYFVVSTQLAETGMSSTGVGNENIYQNKLANFAMRFVLVDAA